MFPFQKVYNKTNEATFNKKTAAIAWAIACELFNFFFFRKYRFK